MPSDDAPSPGHRHQLVRGDCLAVLPALPPACVDLVFADLPYGVTDNRWDVRLDPEALWAALLRVGKPGCRFVFSAMMRLAVELIETRPKLFRYDLIWDKSPMVTGFLNAKKAPLRCHENLLVFCRDTKVFFPQMAPGRPYTRFPKDVKHSSNYRTMGCPKPTINPGVRYPKSVVTIPPDRSEGRLHPTQKPTALLQWIIRSYSRPGDLVLDPTAGIMTTSVAAQMCGRRSIGIERDRRYFALGLSRVQAAVAGAPLPVARAPRRPAAAPQPASQGRLFA